MSALPPTRLALIAAVAANGVIGRRGQLPWHLPDDLKRFKQLTLGHAIIMGRKTYESIGKPLPGRQNIVVSCTLESPPHPAIELVALLEDAVSLAGRSPSPSFVIGGAVLYAAALPSVDVMHMTELDDAVEGNAFFPQFDKSQWRVTDEVRHERDERHAFAFHFRTYERIRG